MSQPDSRFRARMTRLWVQFLAWVIRRHIDEVLGKAHQKGDQEGHHRGYQEGHKAGFEEGQRIYRFEDLRSPPESKPIDEGLYGPERWIVTDAKRNAMREEVAAAVKEGLIKSPTDEQWAMILADHPATCISAGAGSGKSTTLVLRVIFMLMHLKVPRHEITVISFTCASCAELRHALGKVLEYWQGAPVPEGITKRMVRTFHSVLLGLTRRPLPDAKFFELIKKNEVDEHASEDQEDVDNPMSNSRFNERQIDHLARAYRRLYVKDERFRGHILGLLALELARASAYPPDERFLTKKSGFFHYFQVRDLNVTRAVSETWRAHGWPFPGVTDEPIPLFTYKGNKGPFYANGFVTATGLPVVLGFAPELSPQQKKTTIHVPPANPTTFANALSDRLRTIGTFCDRPYVMIRNQDDVDLLALRQTYVDVPANASIPLRPPMFKIKLQGDLKSLMIYEAMFVQGSFVESMGVDVVDLLKRIPAFQHEGIEHHFCYALGYYWLHLAEALHDKGLMTFNRAFQTLTKEARTIGLDPGRLRELRHLLVDEFQDISPQIAFWLTAMQRRLQSMEPAKPLSIMSIGDDWQSIYGWRGSSPQLFIEFGHYFVAHAALGAAPPQFLKANYRSVAPIVEDASRLLGYVSSKVDKPCEPRVPTQAGDHGVRLSTYAPERKDASEKEAFTTLCNFIEEQYQAALAMPGAKAEHVIVMTRRRDLRDSLEKALGQRPGLRFCTYHQAKGLEADIAILIEDCAPRPSHPLRNLFYRHSGVFQKDYTYDQATMDEAYRLAYVGVTRGRRRVFWKVQDIERTVTAKCYGS